MRGFMATIFFLYTGLALAAPGQRISGHLLVLLEEGVNPQRVINRLDRLQPDAEWQYGKPLGIRHNIHLLYFNERNQPAESAMIQAERFPEVVYAQFNYWLEPRRAPDDPRFFQQNSLPLINVESVWDETTGGVTVIGDTIVVAILDFSFDRTHPDLVDNWWRNRAEIPDDGIDNDRNGYVDDVIGYDFNTKFPPGGDVDHGTAVSGIIGARGNNDTGISGINWNIQLMPLTVLSVDDIIAAYEYVIDQRQRYDESDGATGAFVVVTNASLGVENQFCSRFPLWRNMYDQLGALGILSVSSATNSGQDVERFGDVPSTCPSDFLITVTDSGTDDMFNQTAGFGAQSIDLSAPGDGSFSTYFEGKYGTFCCTSGAAPHVSGTIALLYSLPCLQLAEDARRSPVSLARRMRQAILDSTDPVSGLIGRSVTGGRLNAGRAMEVLQVDCGTNQPLGRLSITNLSPNPTSDRLQFGYRVPQYDTEYQIRVFDSLGRLVHRESLAPSRFGELTTIVDLPALPPGMYTLSFEGAGERVAQLFGVVR